MSAPFSPAFLKGEPRASPFLPGDFRDPLKRLASVHRAGARRVSARTLAALEDQTAQLTTSPARLENLAALKRPGTTVVVTGQQVGLFLGPLYSLYKAATAISIARELERASGQRCVPVFWLQSEDHDFDEVNHCYVPSSRDGSVMKIALEGDERQARCSMRSRTLGAGVEQALTALETALDGTPHAAEVMRLFRAHYRADFGWVTAFARTLGEFFAAEGLLILDPRDPALAAELRPIHERAVREANAWSTALADRVRALEGAGFSAQVHVRPGAPLSFFHPHGAEGARFRLEAAGEQEWSLVGAASEPVTTSTLLDTLERAPLCFSTSALLRPVVQDTLLPTAAIVAGPGEINYFAQVQPLYAACGLDMPMVVPRARFRVVDARTRSLLETLKLTAEQAEAPRDRVLERVLTTSTDLTPVNFESEAHAALNRVLDALPQGRWPEVDDGVALARGTMTRAFGRLAARYARALRHDDQVLVERVDRIRRTLMPNDEPQERVHSLASYAARFGLEQFKQLIFASLVPFDAGVKVLEP